jgi:hypothetical protein
MKSIKNKIRLATCSLLATTGNAVAEEIENAWELDSSYLYYSEEDRVTVNKLIGTAKGFVSPKNTAAITVVFDTMTGATPSGAVKNSAPQTSTGASGGTGIGGSTSAAALSDFDDTRVGVSLDWQHEHSRTFNMNYNGAFSVENDYQSVSGAVTANKETADRATKFSLGLAFTYDTIFRTGARTTPKPISKVSDDLSNGEGEKASTDLIAGISQVINRRTVAQFNLAVGQSKGYLTDPYKVFSVVDSNNIEFEQYYEGRPDNRLKWSITANLNHQLFPSNNYMHLSYRYYSDDWDIQSHTLDYSYRFVMNNANYLEPRIRLYTQTQADFYQNSFEATPGPDPVALPEFISADYRLDQMSDVTVGLTYGNSSPDSDLRIRLEYLYQSFENSEFDTNKAIIVQLSYSKRF